MTFKRNSRRETITTQNTENVPPSTQQPPAQQASTRPIAVRRGRPRNTSQNVSRSHSRAARSQSTAARSLSRAPVTPIELIGVDSERIPPSESLAHATIQPSQASVNNSLSQTSSSTPARAIASLAQSRDPTGISQASALSREQVADTVERNDEDQTTHHLQPHPYEEFSLTRIIHEAQHHIFRRKVFWIGGSGKSYSCVYVFYNSEIVFDEKPSGTLEFKCKLCSTPVHVPLGRSGNLLKHIETHTEALPWVQLYREHANQSKQFRLDANTYHLIRFFVNSNVAIEALRDPDLRELVKVDLPDPRTFRTSILPRVRQILQNIIVDRLKSACSVSLIADIWSDKRARDFIAVCAVLHHSVFLRESIVIDVRRMEGSHNAEGLKTAIERIINELEFDKSKIRSIVTDEGSNFLRLFKQYINENEQMNLYIEISGESENSEDEIDESESDEEDYEKDETRITFLETDKSTIDEYSECRSIGFQQSVPLTTETQNYIINVEFNEAAEYIGDCEPMERLELEIGSSSIPRFSCAAHKLNIAVRMSIRKHPEILNMLTTLSKFASKSHKSCKIARIFEEGKCRLRTDNNTRWSSAFLMMVSFLKAYERGCFNDSLPFPVDQALLETYVQILMPIHKFSLNVQRSDCSIGQVLPLLWLLIHGSLQRMVLSNEPKVFRDFLLEAIRNKFKYELTSNVYLAAAVLNVEYMSAWVPRSFTKEFLKKGIEALPDVGLLVLAKGATNEPTATANCADGGDSDNDSIFGFTIQNKLKKSCTISNINEELTASSLYLQIEEEKIKYTNILREIKYNYKNSSLAEFWIKHRQQLPLLYELALHLLVIPASSAYIERFFSISGIINSKRSANMDSETLQMKAVLKANTHLLKKSISI